MRTLVAVFLLVTFLTTAYAGGLGGGYGVGLGYAPAVGYAGGPGVGGVGVGSSVALLNGGPGFSKAVAGPAFLIRTVHHVSKIHGGGAIVAHSGLGAGGLGYGGLGYGGLGYGGLGYGGLGYGGLGYGVAYKG